MDRTHLDWPFFAAEQRELVVGLDAWCGGLPEIIGASAERNVDDACRRLVRALGEGGWLRYCVSAAHGGALPALDSRALCVARETLAYHDGLADFAFAMQGLGSGAITLAGSAAQRDRWLPLVARGEAIAAFALSEPDAGSDVAALATRGCSTAARRGFPTAASPIFIASSRVPATRPAHGAFLRSWSPPTRRALPSPNASM